MSTVHITDTYLSPSSVPLTHNVPDKQGLHFLAWTGSAFAWHSTFAWACPFIPMDRGGCYFTRLLPLMIFISVKSPFSVKLSWFLNLYNHIPNHLPSHPEGILTLFNDLEGIYTHQKGRRLETTNTARLLHCCQIYTLITSHSLFSQSICCFLELISIWLLSSSSQ